MESDNPLLMPIYKFRNCYLNTAERRALMDGKYVKLTPKTLDMLQLLIEKRGDVVSKDEILGRVWNGSFVEEGNLPVHISTLRRLFGEDKTRTFIETVPGTGYRFVAPVQPVTENEWEECVSRVAAPEEKRHKELLLDSIAVLPLQNESNDPEIEYLVDGLTESFINNLSHISGLKVLARNTVFRYKNKKTDAQKVGETLGVAAVLTGRLRIVKDRMTISVELTDVANGKQLWGTLFTEPFTEIIEVREQIIFAVAAKLSSEINQVAHNRVTHFPTKNTESYRLYLKGKYFLEKRSVANIYKAIEYFQQSIFQDSGNVFSYIRIIEGYLFLYTFENLSHESVSAKIRPFLPVLSDLKPTIDIWEVVYSLKENLDWNFEKALGHLQKAIAINPNCIGARQRYSHFLAELGRMPEALEELKYVFQLDPLSVFSYKNMSKVFYKARQYENALLYIKESLELEPDDWESSAVLGCILAEVENYDEALAAFQKCLSIEYNVEPLAMIGYIHARAGRKNEAHQILNQLDGLTDRYVPHFRRAVIHGALGDMEKAFEYLDKSFGRHEADLSTLKVDPRLDSLRHDKRLEELIKKVGLPV